MKNAFLVLSIGFAMFSMFFGSGNLVFPISVGVENSGNHLAAAVGILFTGVFVPFLGVFGMMLYNGSNRDFFSCMGKKVATFWFPLLALSLMGPFGVLARCLTVAHGGLQMLFPTLSLPVASALLCGVIFLLTVNKNKIVSVLGTYLTPFLLLSLGAITFFGLSQVSLPDGTPDKTFNALKDGFFQGYQTMDLLAAFFFSTFVLNHLNKTSEKDQKSKIKVFMKASLVGAGILSAVYVALVFLGSAYSKELATTPPQEMLAMISMKALGPMATLGVCSALVLACLTTAMVLACLFSDFLRKEVTQDKISYPVAMACTLTIGFLVSTLEFAGIARFIGPILELIYPALITLTVVNIAHKLWKTPNTHWPVTLTLAARIMTL